MAPLVLLTGATGLVGFRVLREVLNGNYRVRITVRSEEKSKTVFSNPAIEKLSPGDRLTSTIVTDVTADGAFDEALKEVTYVIHAGSPVPLPGLDPLDEVWKPTVDGTANLLATALKVPSIKRVVVTSSIVGTMAPMPDPSVTVTAASRVQLPGIPETFSDGFQAYVLAKITEMNNTDSFVEKHSPHFSLAHVVPGYVFGRDELVSDANTAVAQGGSCGVLLRGVSGIDGPGPIHGGYVHIDDLAQIFVKVLELEPTPETPRSFGACTNIDFSVTWEIVEKAFPKAVSEGTFKKATLLTLPISYDSSETERVLNIKFRAYDEAVKDVAQLYLDRLGGKAADIGTKCA
jgi:nucleoside-diphosphate-sugar epimerase